MGDLAKIILFAIFSAIKGLNSTSFRHIRLMQINQPLNQPLNLEQPHEASGNRQIGVISRHGPAGQVDFAAVSKFGASHVGFKLNLGNRAGLHLPPIHVDGTSLVVLGMVKKVAQEHIPSMKELASLCKYFDEGHCHVRVMTPSIDPKLQDEIHNPKSESHIPQLRFLEDPKGEYREKPRTHKYAVLRNSLLEMGREMNTDYLMPADLDDIVRWNKQTFGAITNALAPKHRDKWDGVAFVSDSYYDWWAARCELMSPNCWARRPDTCFNMDYYPCVKQQMASSQESFVPVAYAFNGLALYRANAISDCQYDGHQQKGRPDEVADQVEDCEHVAFNNCMVNSGKQFMLSSLAIQTR